MIISMKPGATKSQIDHVCERVRAAGYTPHPIIGATRAESLSEVRKIAPDHFLLIPGIGAQGGDLESVVRHGMNGDIGLIVNASRSILYASSGIDFHQSAKKEAEKIKEKMKILLENNQ